MRPMKTCIKCGEFKEHHAHGLCNKCYRLEYVKPFKKCSVCGNERSIMARGMCTSCYKRIYRGTMDEGGTKIVNRESSNFLGVDVAEQMLSLVFNDVKLMPINHPGYDFICNHGKKIDVKSACMRTDKKSWGFCIRKNKTPDYFLCIAFDDRDGLNPLHLWLLPGELVNTKVSASIALTRINKWDEYRLDIVETLKCCNDIKEGNDE